LKNNFFTNNSIACSCLCDGFVEHYVPPQNFDYILTSAVYSCIGDSRVQCRLGQHTEVGPDEKSQPSVWQQDAAVGQRVCCEGSCAGGPVAFGQTTVGQPDTAVGLPADCRRLQHTAPADDSRRHPHTRAVEHHLAHFKGQPVVRHVLHRFSPESAQTSELVSMLVFSHK